MDAAKILFHVSDAGNSDKRLSKYIDYLNHDCEKMRAVLECGQFIVWKDGCSEEAALADRIEYIEAGSGGRKWSCTYDEQKRMFTHTSADEKKEVRCSDTIHYETWDKSGFWCYVPTWYDNKQVPVSIIQSNTYDDYKKQIDLYIKIDISNNIASDIVLNENEKKLDNYMDSLRKDAMNGKYVMAVRYAQNKPKYYPPIHPFYDAKAKLESNLKSPENKIFSIFNRMPKGGNLHIHTSATLSVEGLFELLDKFDSGAYSNEDCVYEVYVLTEDIPETNALKNTLYLVDNKDNKKALEQYAKFSDLTDAQKEDLKSDLCFCSDEKVKDAFYIWDAFNNAFSRVSTILKNRKFYCEYYVNAFEEQIKDNIDYIELRCGTPSFSDNAGDVVFRKDAEISEAIEQYPYAAMYEAYKTVKENHPDFGLKLIISGTRSKDKELIKQEALHVMEYMEDPPKGIEENFIIGYDLVGEEDRGNETDYYAQGLYEVGCVGKLPFYLHDGESCWADDNNVYAAFTLGSRRIGHGLNLYRFPTLLEIMKDNGVALEVCPISNQLLRYTSDLRMHPIGEYLNRGVPCTVCSDDPLILGNPGLAYDFWELYLGQLLDLREIKKLIINSYQFSGMTQEERQKKTEAWTEKWDQFVEDMQSEII